MASLGQVTHVIFDLDGLLLNTEDIYGAVFDEMAMLFSHRHFTQDSKRQVQGRCLTEGEQLFKEMYGVRESLEEIDQTAHALLDKMLPTADLMPGAERLVKHLYAHNIPMAIATGSDPAGFAVKTSRHREFFDKHFKHVVMSGDPAVKHGKPAPDVFLAAAARFANQPPSKSNFLVFDDAYLGIKGALAAEMPCVWVPSIPDMDTSLLPATLVLRSLADFRPELFGLPPFDAQLNENKVQQKTIEQQDPMLSKKRELRALAPNIVAGLEQ